MPNIHNDFNPSIVTLEKSNLIEASAGTGKTYSIALLALRLILEKGMPIEQILMVTFTRDAAAEMEIRVRAFIREALNVARCHDGEFDKTIVDLVHKFGNNNLAIERLQSSLVQFDKAAIFTIHGFCSRILSEFSFESGQLFHANTMESEIFNELLQDAFNQSWRENFTILDPEQIRLFMKNNHTRDKMLQLVKGHLAGKRIYLTGNRIDIFDRMNENLSEIQLTTEKLRTAIEDNIETWASQADQLKSHAKTHLKPLIVNRDIEKLFEKIKNGHTKTGYIRDNIQPDILRIAAELEDLESNSKKLITGAFTSIAINCCEYVEQTLKSIQQTEGQITFDDMIKDLHRTLCDNSLNPEEGVALANILRSRYHAVFIDEFQDTDRLQYEIFSYLFQNSEANKQHILFYIGDPKQSIYAFRKADLQTYFRAADAVDAIYRMNTNYRSTKQYIQAMNDFFQPLPDFDVFLSDQMQYYSVTAPSENEKSGGILYKDRLLEPLRIFGCSKKENIYPSVVKLLQVLLLNPDFTLSSGDTKKKINPGQIGILVRSKADGRIIRKDLAKKGIPAITVSDEKVFESPEARDLLNILQAVEKIDRGNINRALMTRIGGFSWLEMDTLDEDQLLQQFLKYQEVWKSNGVYVFLRHFLRDVQAIKRKRDGSLQNADRVLADTFQLMEMLHEAEAEKNYSSGELINWLKKGIEGDFTSENQYLQRIESDEKAVKIVTIHSSKGLEYDIVIAPFLDLVISSKHKTVQFYNEENYYTADKELLDELLSQKALEQARQENMRLLYVAITRARNHCYLMNAANASASSLQYLISPILSENKSIDGIRFLAIDQMNDAYTGNQNFEETPPEFAEFTQQAIEQIDNQEELLIELPKLQLNDFNWQKTSYSALNPSHDPVLRAQENPNDEPYDRFIFRELRRGKQSGNLLHDFLERIDFTSENQWSRIIKNTLHRYPGTDVNIEHESLLKNLLNTITSTQLPGAGFCLNSVKRSQRLSEFEFDLPLTHVDFKQFPEMLEEGQIPLRINREKQITGILNGKIDLFFEQNGRYYVIDWKSNHLGYHAVDYSKEALASAMEEHNYYLQYYFYCLALYRYLRIRVPNFNYTEQFGGVYYLFLRGMRLGTEFGIYQHKPREQDLINIEKLLLIETT